MGTAIPSAWETLKDSYTPVLLGGSVEHKEGHW